MTTRAGLVGIISGFLISIFVHVLMAAWTGVVVHNGVFLRPNWIVEGGIALLVIIAGYWAAKWNHSMERWRCISLGSFAGIVAVIILFNSWGAAFAVIQLSIIQNVPIAITLQFTIAGFLKLLLIGGLFGGLGGFFYHPSKTTEKDVFNKDEPQMAMNGAITAVPASVVAVGIAAYTFPKLSNLIGNSAGINGPYLFPCYAALVLVVLSQFALTLVIPHETEQAEHVSGMDEVKMAAFVDIGTAPMLFLFLLIIDKSILGDLFAAGLLICSFMMSLYAIRLLIKWVLPKRKSYPQHPTQEQKTQAALFGSIAKSKAWRLVTLCIGCGLAMVFPIYIAVLAPLININIASENSQPVRLHSELAQHLFWTHIKTGMGINLIVIVVLSAMYIFYLNLGKWFYKKQAIE